MNILKESTVINIDFTFQPLVFKISDQYTVHMENKN